MAYDYYGYGDKEDSPRYQAAVRRRIEMNRLKGQQKRAQERSAVWLAEDESRIQLLVELGFAADQERNHGFMCKMRESFGQWGSLTEKQEAAVRKVLASREEQKVQRAAENEALAARSNHVGKVAERKHFVLSVDRVFEFESRFGLGYGHIMHDSDGNVFVYFGQKLADKGQAIRVKATIKKHDVREGVKQTVINRPADVEIINYGVDNESDFDADIQASEAANHGY